MAPQPQPSIELIYDPDDSCGRLPHDPDQGAAHGEYHHYSGGRSGGKAPPAGSDRTMRSLLERGIAKFNTNGGRLELDMDNVGSNRRSRQKAQKKLINSMAMKKYEILREKSKRNRRLYEDPDFPATAESIGPVTGLNLNNIEWKRPKEIFSDGEFILDEIDRFDIKQGALGNCWLLAVISSVTNYPKLLNYVMPQDQKIQSPEYTGMFHFRFWQFGKWEEVIIDDRLPVKRGTNELVFMHSADHGEFWSPLIEKAYAKLNGSYASLEGGQQADAMEDFTGGICETVELSKAPETLYEDMKFYSTTCTLMGVSKDATSNTIEERQTSGIVKGHAYSITGVDSVTYQGREQRLVRCRNPWGTAEEWRGPFGDRTSEWNGVSEQDKQRLKVTFAADGEFWMPLEDFMREWSRLEICHLGGASLEEGEDLHEKRKLEESIFTGEWKWNVSAGGCLNYKDTFHMNPQYKIVVEDDGHGHGCEEMVLIGLMQKDKRGHEVEKNLSIGFLVYKIDDDHQGLLKREYIASRRHIAMSKFSTAREQVLKLRLKPGQYAIIPSSFKPNEESVFILRVYTAVPVGNEIIDNKTTKKGVTDEIRKRIHSGHHGHDDDKKVKAHFDRVKDEEGFIAPKHLVAILNDSPMKEMKDFDGFSVELGRNLAALVDDDISGWINWQEFEQLWEDCELWKFIFEDRDLNKCGHLDSGELRDAINMAGFTVSNRVFASIIYRYADGESGEVHFGDFIMCMARLKNCVSTMNIMPRTTTGERIFTEDEFMQFAIYT